MRRKFGQGGIGVVRHCNRIELRLIGERIDDSAAGEGVENEGQKHFLRGLGCEQAQGYLFSRPVDADAMAQLLGAKQAQVRKVRV